MAIALEALDPALPGTVPGRLIVYEGRIAVGQRIQKIVLLVTGPGKDLKEAGGWGSRTAMAPVPRDQQDRCGPLGITAYQCLRLTDLVSVTTGIRRVWGSDPARLGHLTESRGLGEYAI